MSNITYSGEIVNKDIKEEFLKGYTEGTQKTMMGFFRRTCSSELYFNKDLFNFSIEEIDFIFTSAIKKSISTTRVQLNYLTLYIEWAINKGYTETNPMQYINTSQYASKYFEQTKFLTVRDIDNIVDSCVNFQDKAVIQMLFEGVGGKEFSELLNLTSEDIKIEARKLHLKNSSGSEREIEVSEKCIKLIQEALQETTYKKKTKENARAPRSDKLTLMPSDRVIKLSHTRSNETGIADIHLIYRRIKSISTQMKMDFTARLISQSGMLYYLYNLTQHTSNIIPKDLATVCIRFNEISPEYEEKVNEKQILYKYKNLLTEINLQSTYNS